MKLGLLGFPIEHSLSPTLYKKFLNSKLTSYELFSFDSPIAIPPLSYFSERLHGLNITSPYKRHFINEVSIPDKLVKSFGAVNTLAFKDGKTFATNTDYLAIVDILKNYREQYPELQILLLGDGVMAELTKLVAETQQIPLLQFSRKVTENFSQLDLRPFHRAEIQTVVINSCSRDFIFSGNVEGSEIFWDYNYAFLPHKNNLSGLVKVYQDGQEMLERQALEAIKFWKSYI